MCELCLDMLYELQSLTQRCVCLRLGQEMSVEDLPSSSTKVEKMMNRWEAMEASLELIAHELWYNEVQQTHPHMSVCAHS